MLTDQESTDMHRMVTELENSKTAHAWGMLKRLADTTGDEWDRLVRRYLAEWRSSQP